MITMKLEGFEQVKAAFDSVVPKLKRQALRKGVDAGARIVRDEARERAPKFAGRYPAHRRALSATMITKRAELVSKLVSDAKKLAKAEKKGVRRVRLTRSYQLRKPGNLRRGIITGSPGKRTITEADGIVKAVGLNKGAFYGKFIEKGWKHRTSKRGRPGKVTHIMRNPFLWPALNANRQKVINAIRDEAHKALENMKNA